MTSETYLPSIGGAEIHVDEMRKRIGKFHELKLITLSKGKKEKNLIRLKDKTIRDYFIIIKTLNKEIKNCDLIHAHYSYKLAFFSGILAKIHKKPMIIILHGLGILDNNWPLIPRIFHRICRRFSLKLATRIISTSEDLSLNVKKFTNPDKVKIISNGVDVKHFLKGKDILKTTKRVMISVRRFNDKNGIHLLMDALPYLKQLNPNFLYLIIGWGKHEELIKQKIKNFALEQQVQFLGKVDNRKITDYLYSSHVVVFPSSAESTSLACIEAMLTHNLIVSSKVGGLIELIGKKEERGLFMKMFPWTHSNYNPPMQLSTKVLKHMAEVLHSALFNTKKYSDKILAAQSYAKNFDWDIITKKTLEVYDEAITK